MIPSLSSFCIDTPVIATKENKAMVAVFKKLGFEVTYNEDNTVSVSKQLKK